MLPADMLRFICQDCGIKWFVGPRSPQVAPRECGACGGELAVLPDDDPPPAFAPLDPD